MERKLKLGLNRFTTIPSTLLDASGNSITEIKFEVSRVCRTAFIDSFNVFPLQVIPLNYAFYQKMISDNEYFRFVTNGLGNHTEIRRGESNKWGKAFCRMFLEEHLDMKYFIHMDEVLNKGSINDSGYKIERVLSGDTPDYICLDSTNTIYLAEAKGRKNSISFSSSEFVKWRQQFDRVSITDNSGNSYSAKGYIVATRLIDESEYQTVKPNILVEDPNSPGSEKFIIENLWPIELTSGLIKIHYARFLRKLNLNNLSNIIINNKKYDEIIEKELSQLNELTLDDGVQYIGRNLILHDYSSFSSRIKRIFIGIKKEILELLIKNIIAEENLILEIDLINDKFLNKEFSSNEDIAFFKDGTVIINHFN